MTRQAASIVALSGLVLVGLLLAFTPLAANASRITPNGTLTVPERSSGWRRSLFFLPFGRYMCFKSGLKGYSSMLKLQYGLVLHWKATKGKTISFAIQARKGSAAYKAGWFAVGWSPSGDMGGSNVVAYESGADAAAPYDLVGQSAAVAATSWTPGSLTVTTGNKGGRLITFTRSPDDGASVKVRNSGGANIVFAYGPDSSVAMHSNAEHTVTDFSCGCGPFGSGC
ncbi:hypothetical protein CLOP_g1252 [Closterium sp. NIES-67]|nr:hypothetical protein CLOP_g1252 [Closterium sp. NIES-67]